MNRIIIYKTANGREPYVDYLRSLRDSQGAARIRARLFRAESGNLGDYRSVGNGVLELRIHFGPGYRVYIGLDGHEQIIVLTAEDKDNQNKDIQKSRDYWDDYQRDQ